MKGGAKAVRSYKRTTRKDRADKKKEFAPTIDSVRKKFQRHVVVRMRQAER